SLARGRISTDAPLAQIYRSETHFKGYARCMMHLLHFFFFLYFSFFFFLFLSFSFIFFLFLFFSLLFFSSDAPLAHIYRSESHFKGLAPFLLPFFSLSSPFLLPFFSLSSPLLLSFFLFFFLFLSFFFFL